MKTLSIKEHKHKKKLKRIIEDIDKMLEIFTKTQMCLSFFKPYVAAQEIVSILETNKTLLELQRKRYSGDLEKLEKGDTDANKLQEVKKEHT